MTIKEGSAAYNAFVETPIPTMTKFYFFDILNPRRIMERDEKPSLEERGPYTFRWMELYLPTSHHNITY